MAQELGEFFELMPPMQRTGANWYMGTADAVYQNIYSIGSEQPKHVIILSGDHIYKMDYSRMLAHHKETNAEVTLATLPIAPEDVSRFGVVEVGRTGRGAGVSGEAGIDQLPVAIQSRMRWMPRWGFTSSIRKHC